MPIREIVRRERFNPHIRLPYELRAVDFEMAMRDL